MKHVILASTSKYRKELLERLAIEFECMAPNVDEDLFKEKIADPTELAKILAKEKANAIAKNHPSAIVIGSDQLAECEGRILGKAPTEKEAFEQLNFLSGKEHKLITAFTVINNKEEISKVNTTVLRMKKLSPEQIKKYIQLDKPFDCAGTYKLELHGISLFDKIETTDHSAIIGLPLIELGNVLSQLGQLIPPPINKL